MSAAGLGAGKVGPNAIIQLADVLADRLGLDERAAALRAAGLARYLAADPDRMTDECEAAALHRVVQARQPRDWGELSWEAGTRTAGKSAAQTHARRARGERAAEESRRAEKGAVPRRDAEPRRGAGARPKGGSAAG